MALACQKNSYLKKTNTVVESCEPHTEKISGSPVNGYNITLEDTVLFPEGGGQPDDRGMIDELPVLKVSLVDNKALHFTPTPLDVGSKVTVQVDWGRRFDHMQQHSAQHLITAVAETKYNYKTTSWSLGETVCKIEMNVPSITAEQLDELELLCNGYIREQRTMYPTYYDSADDPRVAHIKTRGLPDNLTGPIRVMTIEGIDENLCCGTHVSNLAHLQAVKLLGTEKGKKGCVNVLFHAGNRVLSSLGKSLDIERRINTLMKGSPSDYPDLIKKLQNSYKVANKSATNLLREIVVFEAQKFSESLNANDAKYLLHHRKEGDIEYMNSLVQHLTCRPDVVKFLTVGDERGAGSFLLQGPVDSVTALGPRVLELIEGKGAGKNGKFQGKANKLSQKHKVEQLIKDCLSQADS